MPHPRSRVPLATLCALLGGLGLAPDADAATVTSFPDDEVHGSGEQGDGDPAATTESSEARGRAGRRRSVIGDLNSRWFHVGGGGGVVADPLGGVASVAGRFVLGGGAYTLGFYAGGGMEVTGSLVATPGFSVVGNFGFAVPVPVVHPLFGLRALVGLHGKEAGGVTLPGFAYVAPHVGLGLQGGFIIREFDGKPGLRLMLDSGVEWRAETGKALPDLFVTLAAVF